MNAFYGFFVVEHGAIAAYLLVRLRRSAAANRHWATYEAQSRERMALAQTTTDLMRLADAPLQQERARELAEHEHATRLAIALRARAQAEADRDLAIVRRADTQHEPEVVQLSPAPSRLPKRRRMSGRPEVLPGNYHYREHDENRHCSTLPPCREVRD